MMISATLPLALVLIGSLRSLHRDMNLGDEGYLVYGTLALMRGEVPIRDFRAYDPGRYLWCAVFFRIFGPGFVSARIAMACLSGLTAVLVVSLALWASDAPTIAALTGCLAVLWMQPFHKQGEVLFSVVCIVAIVALGSDFAPIHWVGALIVLGAAYGHNILVYMIAAVALFGLMQIAAGEPVSAQFRNLFVSLAVGFSLMVGLGALIPGYWRAFWVRKVRAVLARGSANLPLAKPWLWSGQIRQIAALTPARQRAFKTMFTTMPILCGLAIVCWVWMPSLRSEPAGQLLMASAVTGLAFLHHLWSRTDLSHLCQAMQPFVLLCCSAAALTLPWALAVTVLLLACLATIAFLWRMQDFARSWKPHGPAKPFETVYEQLWLSPNLADRLNRIKDITNLHGGPGQSMLAVPINMALVAALDRRTAVYDCFPVYPSTTRAQVQMLKELEQNRPGIAIIGKTKVDGRDDLLFDRNYDQVSAYIREHYAPVFESSAETVYVRRDA